MFASCHRLPSISIVLPVHRLDPHLAQAISSVLKQTHRDFELLIGVNGKADGVTDCVRRLTAGDPRVCIHELKLGQLAFVLNYLIEKSNGEWIVRMDSDDVCRPDRIAKLLPLMLEGSVDVVGSWARVIDANGRVIGRLTPPVDDRSIRRTMWRGSPLIHPAVAFRRDFWLDIRGYLGGFVTEDTELWMRAAHSRITFANIPEELLDYRIHGDQAARTLRSYTEVAGHWFREVLENPNLSSILGLMLATSKALARRLGVRLGRSDRMFRASSR